MVNYNRTSQRFNQQQEMLLEIQKLQFAALDTALYLDTHPNDPVALYRHKMYTDQLKQVKDAYEMQFGPMTIFSHEVGDNWRYINSPWPWEI
ncbi:MAG: spore coat protein CotJB [Tissierellia bacterium]|jgi:spore coat protein JB|nr:spore coat protein CotJB [Tissierellia bacterium]MDD3750829.1 spore coat protein CotJB [Tissierellia bacterium]MDD4678216.1 spore coat protein CotJB [Tissierellia bacterium]